MSGPELRVASEFLAFVTEHRGDSATLELTCDSRIQGVVRPRDEGHQGRPDQALARVRDRRSIIQGGCGRLKSAQRSSLLPSTELP